MMSTRASQVADFDSAIMRRLISTTIYHLTWSAPDLLFHWDWARQYLREQSGFLGYDLNPFELDVAADIVLRELERIDVKRALERIDVKQPYN